MKRHFFLISILIVLCMPVKGQANDKDWQSYTNKQYGFSFQHPGSWSKLGKESEAINRSGVVMSVLVNFIDTVSHSTLLIEYHLAPGGAELYKYSKSQFDSLLGAFAIYRTQIMVDGNEAIEGSTTISQDIKGNIISPPVKEVSVQFLDKQQTGELELHFKTPLPADREAEKFLQVISTFKFIN